MTIVWDYFTEGQKTRMRAIFAPGGARAALVGN